MNLTRLAYRTILILTLPVAPVEIIMDGWKNWKKEFKEMWSGEMICLLED